MATKLRVPSNLVGVICFILCARVALALLPSKIGRVSVLSPHFRKGMHNKQANVILGVLLPNNKSKLYSSITDETAQTARVDNRIQNNTISQQYANAISTHIQNALQSAKKSLNNDGDISIQSKHMEYAEQVLIQWVEQYRGQSSSSSSSSSDNDGGLIHTEEQRQLIDQVPDANVFSSVIEGLLSLPSSFSAATIEERVDNSDAINSSLSLLQDITESENKVQQNNNNNNNMHRSEKNKSDRATQVLDLMESFHEPPGALYDAIISSHCEDALHCLSSLTKEKDIEQEGTDWTAEDDDDESRRNNSNDSPYSQRAWKSAKLGLQLLNRAEDLYHEMGQNPSQLPSVSSYVSVMDVWKALAMSIEGVDEKKKLDEVLEVVRHVRNRRLKVYTLDQDTNDAGNTNHDNKSGFGILPAEVLTMPVQEVLLYATSILRESEPWYKLWIDDYNKIGTWHFNQLIFDLAKYPQTFSGPLANDLLEYMMYMVKKTSPPPSKQRKKKKQQQQQMTNTNVPKPNVKTINGVLKAWMVTTNHSDVARRAEAVLAKLATWQAQGILWGVSADTVSYNTCMNIWKNSKVPGSAQRAQEILSLMEDESTLIQPDVISYSTSIGAWAECSSRDPSAGRRAEEILLRMYNRTKDALEDESIVAPRPTTRCFNAVFLAYANGKQKGGGKRALELLRFMERLNSEGYANLSPDTYTFNIVMKVSTTVLRLNF